MSYTTTQNIPQIGSIAATAERRHAVWLPPIIGGLLVGAAGCLLAIAALSKKD